MMNLEFRRQKAEGSPIKYFFTTMNENQSILTPGS